LGAGVGVVGVGAGFGVGAGLGVGLGFGVGVGFGVGLGAGAALGAAGPFDGLAAFVLVEAGFVDAGALVGEGVDASGEAGVSATASSSARATGAGCGSARSTAATNPPWTGVGGGAAGVAKKPIRPPIANPKTMPTMDWTDLEITRWASRVAPGVGTRLSLSPPDCT